MQAIILAAGMGSRLGKYTANNTKCMLTINGRTLIERLLENRMIYPKQSKQRCTA